MYYYPQNYHSYYRNQHTDWRTSSFFKQIEAAVIKGIEGEASAVKFYEQLVKRAPDQEARRDVQHALDDEKIHLQKFKELYEYLTGEKLKYKAKETRFSTFKEGVKLAYEDELEAYEDYRDSYLLTQNQLIRDVFFLAMTDEMEHAVRFGNLYNRLE